MDSADKERKIGMPLLLIWATRGLPKGHHMQEEAPNEIYEHFIRFFTA